ncbi:MAG: hypothetical protein ACP5QO_08335 [Clostridia bacterium]
MAEQSPTWTRWRDIPAVVVHPANLRSTGTIALVVGALLFLVNDLDTMLRSGASASIVVKAALNIVIPFCVSNFGLLTATRRRSR